MAAQGAFGDFFRRDQRHLNLVRATISALLLAAFSGPAKADFRVCNQTFNFFNVAIGFLTLDGGNITTRGWWNLPANSCATPIKEPLDREFYYVYAMDIHGEDAITGSFSFCVSLANRAFDIANPKADLKSLDCRVRGYEPAKFKEIDTGQGAKDWTVYVTGGG